MGFILLFFFYKWKMNLNGYNKFLGKLKLIVYGYLVKILSYIF